MVVMGNLFAHMRVLPVTIFVAALMLTVKVSGISDSFDGNPPALQVAAVLAQEPPAETPPQNAQPNPADSKAEADQDGADAAEGEPDKSDPRAPENDPTLMTQNEIALLQQLAERREELEKSAGEMSVREGILIFP